MGVNMAIYKVMDDREEEDEGERSILFEVAGDEDMKVYLMS